MISTLTEVLDTLDLEQVNADFFVGTQFDGPAHHILGGHIAAQALMAGARTANGRAPHSAHIYFLRPGDGRHPVDFEVTALHDGRTFTARRITGRQYGEVLLEATASFSAEVEDLEYQSEMPVVPDPDTLESVPPQGAFASLDWFERRTIATVDGTRIWWRPNGITPEDPTLARCLLAYLSAVTLTEAALTPRWKTMADPPLSAMRSHSIWFHQPPHLSDWLLYDQLSPSGIGGRGLATGAMFNRTGELVCTAAQELYFPPTGR